MFGNISFNTFDYFATAFIIWQMYIGYKKGFEDIIYGIVKYIVVIAGLYIGNKFLWDILMRSPYFVKRADYINKTAVEYLLQFAPHEALSEKMYTQALGYIAFDKIVFGILLIIITIILTRIIIYGSIVKEESEHKKLGMFFSFFKSIIIIFLFSRFMEVVLGENFTNIKEGSFLLKFFDIKFILGSYKFFLF